MDDFEYTGLAVDTDLDIEWDENVESTWESTEDDDEKPESHTIVL